MNISVNNDPQGICPQTGRIKGYCLVFFLLVNVLLPLTTVQPVSAAENDAAKLSIQVIPASVTTGGTVSISADVVANRLIKVGMYIYRLTGPGGSVHYLEPIIIRDFERGSSHHMDTDYKVGSSPGDWNVEAYLCIGQCAIKGEAPPRNAAVTATGAFTVVNEPPPPPPLPPGPGPLQFHQ